MSDIQELTSQKLAIFDIDGTIAVHGSIPKSVLEGLVHLHELGFLTTVSTGRGYIRAKEVLGEHFDAVVSADSLMIIEHGTKITDRTGVVLKADYFTELEIGNIVDFIQANIQIIKLVWFNSPDPDTRVQVWCADEKDVQEETIKRGGYADVFHCTYHELKKRLLAEPVSNISSKLKSYILVENLKLHLTHIDVDIVYQDSMMEFMKNISDKAKAIAYLEKHHKTVTTNILLAGNAINDVDMLNLSAHTRILVGEGEESDKVVNYLTSPSEVVRVKSPEELGNFLLKFSL